VSSVGDLSTGVNNQYIFVSLQFPHDRMRHGPVPCSRIDVRVGFPPHERESRRAEQEPTAEPTGLLTTGPSKLNIGLFFIVLPLESERRNRKARWCRRRESGIKTQPTAQPSIIEPQGSKEVSDHNYHVTML
jgi:hypothetical protein